MGELTSLFDVAQIKLSREEKTLHFMKRVNILLRSCKFTAFALTVLTGSPEVGDMPLPQVSWQWHCYGFPQLPRMHE